MAYKFRYVDLLVGTTSISGTAVSGEARTTLGLGAPFGRICAVEIKGDDADVNATTAWSVTDAETRLVYVSTQDAGATTFDQYTSQTAIVGTTVGAVSTVGFVSAMGYPELTYKDIDGLANDDTGGESPNGVYAKSPLTITQTSGTNGDWFRFGVWVEV
jgi:hypothetical protein